MNSNVLGALGALLLGLAASPAAWAADPLPYAFTRESTVTYFVEHPMHHVEGISHELQGAPLVTDGSRPDLALPIKLSVPIRSFDSGNRNRDRNMLQVMHAARYPNALLDLRTVDWTSKKIEGTRTLAEGKAKGDLTLNGTTHPVDVQLSGYTEGDRLSVDAAFSFLLSDYAIERPSLLFRPIDDKVRLEIKGIALRQKP